MIAPLIVCEDYDALYRLIYAICHPETIEGYEEVDPDDTPLEAQLAAIDARLGEPADLETVNNLLEEKADILIELEKG
jgi:hypothetical protein